MKKGSKRSLRNQYTMRTIGIATAAAIFTELDEDDDALSKGEHSPIKSTVKLLDSK